MKINKNGFTLLELLLVISIIAVLSSLVVYSLRPAELLVTSNDTKRKVDINSLDNAIQAHSIEKPDEQVLIPEYNPLTEPNPQNNPNYELCSSNATDCTGKVDLRTVLSEYVQNIPEDPSNQDQNGTGYYIAKNAQNGEVNIWTNSGQQTPLISLKTFSSFNVWTQVNTNGFGATGPFTNEDFWTFEVFDSCLYAGIEATITTEGAQVYRSCDGTTWNQVNTNGFGDPAHNGLLDSMKVFNGYLYASTLNFGSGSVGTQIWRTNDGTTWNQVNTSGFGSASNWTTKGLINFDNQLCGGTWNNATGTQFWCTADGTTWVQKNTNGMGNANNRITYYSGIYNGYLYVSLSNTTQGGELWRINDLDTGTWEKVGTNGLGYGANEPVMRGLIEFNGSLYTWVKNGSGGNLEIRKSTDGTSFTTVYTFADTVNKGPSINDSVLVYNNVLYFVTSNSSTGIEVWQTVDGTSWTRVNTDLITSPSHPSGPIKVFNGYMYFGTGNYTLGHRIWRSVI